MRSHNTEHAERQRSGANRGAPAQPWPVLAGLGLGAALLLVLGYAAVSGAARSQVSGTVAATGAQAWPAGIAVACGAGQQAVLKQVEGPGQQPIVQVECVPAPGAVRATASTTAHAPAVVSVGSPLEAPWLEATPAGARAIPAVYQPVRDEVVYQRPARRTSEQRSGRSWQKSAVIIGSTAGIGAGVGAAVGGKKGALIGAAVGGGGAAIWDQVTRRRP